MHGRKLGNKGIFFTFTVFLVIMAVFLVNVSISQSTAKQNEAVADQSAFDAINNRFNDIYNRTISIKSGERGKIQGRILPFSYDSSTYWIAAEQYLPLINAQAIYNDIFNALNLYEIFAESSPINQEYTTTITAQKNPDWNGTTTKFTSVILPQCLSIEPANPEDNTQMLFKAETKTSFEYCPKDFPTSITEAIKTMEITITFTRNSEVLSPECSADFGNCENKAFNQTEFDEGKPYAIVHLIAPDCIAKCGTPPSYCCINNADQTIATNINTNNAENYVIVSLNSGGSIKVDFKNSANPNEIIKIKENNLGTLGVVADANIVFVHPIQELRFNGFENMTISKPNFGIERKTS